MESESKSTSFSFELALASLPRLSPLLQSYIVQTMQLFLKRTYYRLLHSANIYGQINIDRKVLQFALNGMLPSDAESIINVSLERAQQQEESLSNDRPNPLVTASMVSKYIKSLQEERKIKVTRGAKLFLAALLEQLFIEPLLVPSIDLERQGDPVTTIPRLHEQSTFTTRLFSQLGLRYYDPEYQRVVPKEGFERMIREVVQLIDPSTLHLGKHVVELLQWLVETEVISLIRQASTVRSHVKRSTLEASDLLLVIELQGLTLRDGSIVRLHLTQSSTMSLIKRAVNDRNRRSKMLDPIATLIETLLHRYLHPTIQYMIGSKRNTLDQKVLQKGLELIGIILPIHKR